MESEIRLTDTISWQEATSDNQHSTFVSLARGDFHCDASHLQAFLPSHEEAISQEDPCSVHRRYCFRLYFSAVWTPYDALRYLIRGLTPIIGHAQWRTMLVIRCYKSKVHGTKKYAIGQGPIIYRRHSVYYGLIFPFPVVFCGERSCTHRRYATYGCSNVVLLSFRLLQLPKYIDIIIIIGYNENRYQWRVLSDS